MSTYNDTWPLVLRSYPSPKNEVHYIPIYTDRTLPEAIVLGYVRADFVRKRIIQVGNYTQEDLYDSDGNNLTIDELFAAEEARETDMRRNDPTIKKHRASMPHLRQLPPSGDDRDPQYQEFDYPPRRSIWPWVLVFAGILYLAAYFIPQPRMWVRPVVGLIPVTVPGICTKPSAEIKDDAWSLFGSLADIKEFATIEPYMSGRCLDGATFTGAQIASVHQPVAVIVEATAAMPDALTANGGCIPLTKDPDHLICTDVSNVSGTVTVVQSINYWLLVNDKPIYDGLYSKPTSAPNGNGN